MPMTMLMIPAPMSAALGNNNGRSDSCSKIMAMGTPITALAAPVRLKNTGPPTFCNMKSSRNWPANITACTAMSDNARVLDVGTSRDQAGTTSAAVTRIAVAPNNMPGASVSARAPGGQRTVR